MFTLAGLRMPFIAAPMAGGPSTPALAAAAANAGALGFLAGAYKPVEALAAEIEATRSMTGRPFGVNLFVPTVANVAQPAGNPARRHDLTGYRAELGAEAARYGVDLPTTDPSDTDGWEAKVEHLLAQRVPVVSVTFGLPAREVIDRFHIAGTHVTITVTDPDEAAAAIANGADSLCVQGPEAGGHRGTHTVDKTPDQRSLPRLLCDVREVTEVPLIAAGGISNAQQVAELLRLGAAAVQIGTSLLRTPESGASPAHKSALVSGAYGGTTVTRAFSGRLARALTNRFVSDHDGQAPAAYPEVNQLTKTLRAAAAAIDDADGLSLYAGTGFTHSRAEPAADILNELWDATRGVLAV
jgi:nitronate monooxygenase